MARGINKVILIGNLGADPETRYMPSGGAVTNANVATSEQWKDKQTGQPQERTEWHRIVFFNRLAEIAGEYLKKGSKVYIEGSLRTRKWQDDSGQDRYSTEIVANELQMLDGRGDNAGQGNYPSNDQYADNQGGQQQNPQGHPQNNNQQNPQGHPQNNNQQNPQGHPQNNNQQHPQGHPQNNNQQHPQGTQANPQNGGGQGYPQQNGGGYNNANQNGPQNGGGQGHQQPAPMDSFDDDIPFG